MQKKQIKGCFFSFICNTFDYKFITNKTPSAYEKQLYFYVNVVA